MNLFWIGQLNNTVENCFFSSTDNGTEANSVIVGLYNGEPLRIEYRIRTNQLWETIYFEVNSQFENRTVSVSFHGDGKGNWTNNGKPAEKFYGCIDVDISLTPYTNTLPINRFKQSKDKEHLLEVLFIDILEMQMKRVKQKYTRLSAIEYKYENIPNDFEAIITVDESGFVTKYPGLFSRGKS